MRTRLCTGNNCVIYIPASTDLASFELHSLFFDYISMHMAEGRDEGNNHPVSSAVDILPSHFANQTVLQKGTSISYTVLSLPVFMAMLSDVWKVGVPWRRFGLGRLPVGVPGSTGLFAIPRGCVWPRGWTGLTGYLESTPLELSNDAYFLWDTHKDHQENSQQFSVQQPP